MGQTGSGRDIEQAGLNRARSLCSEACHMIALQRRRLQTNEPEDSQFVMRRWADWQFLIVALRRARQAAQIAQFHPDVDAALRRFDKSLPAVQTMRNVGEHIDDYASGRGRNRQVGAGQLQVGSFGENTLIWLGHELEADAALNASERLFEAVRDATIA